MYKQILFSIFLFLSSSVYAQQGGNLAVVPYIGTNDVAILKDGKFDQLVALPSSISLGPVAMSPDGQFAYLADSISNSNTFGILKFSLSLRQIVGSVSFTTPINWRVVDFEISPQGGTLAIAFDHQAHIAIVKTNQGGQMVHTGTLRACESCNGTTQPSFSNPQFSFFDEKTLHATNPVEDEFLTIKVDVTPPVISKTSPMGFGSSSSGMVTDMARFYNPAIPGLSDFVVLSVPGVFQGSRIHEVMLGDLGYFRFAHRGESDGSYHVKLFDYFNTLLVSAAGSMTYGPGQVSDKINLRILNLPGIELELPATEAVREIHYDQNRNLLMGPCEVLGSFCFGGEVNIWNINTLGHQVINAGFPIGGPTTTALTDNFYYVPLSFDVFAIDLNTMTGSFLSLPSIPGSISGVFAQGAWMPRPAY